MPGIFLSGDGRSLQCSAHGALFQPSDGLCTAGPCAGKYLQSVPLQITAEGNIIVVE